MTRRERRERQAEAEPMMLEYEWADPEQVPRMKREGGNPYYDFWRAADGNKGYFAFEDEEIIPPMFADREKLERALGGMFKPSDEHGTWASIASSMARYYATRFYAWAIPGPEALDAIAALDMPIFESGSGRGYWAWQLEQRRLRVVAWEPKAHQYGWFWRRPDRIHARRMPRDHALFFCWPEYGERYAARQLRDFRGSTVIYVGEHGGCNATDEFFRLLERFEPEIVALPSWKYMRDRMTIYRR